MKYIAILDTDEFKDFEFFEDADGKYLAVKDANTKSNEWLPLHFQVLDSCGDAISRQAALDCLTATGLKKFDFILNARTKIKNLPSVTSQPCEDVISRQSVIDIILNSKSSFKNDFVCGFFIDKIRDLSSITPHSKMARWLKTSLTQVSGGDFKRGFKCSHCNYVVVPDDFNYCPNCGAKMQEVDK